MTSQTRGEAQVREVLATFRAELRSLPGDEDLINTRRIDSLTFISVVTALIDRSGRDIDLEAVSTARLRTITGLAEEFYGPEDEGRGTR
ncbi:hypothetical protein [Nocardiopsis halotolerans]|uniref:hypothetical protein n=1 Tax=Nocardiopsis halotolerans TaxID=124252 RepID=UPI0003473B7F|nr:hypothetical protein [Nocardiopsis halotolerans]